MIEPIVNHLGQSHSVWARPSLYGRGIEIGMFKQVPAHSVPVEGKPDQTTNVKTQYYDATLVWKPVEWGTVEINNPTGFAILPYDMAQQLMEALWNAGVRPSQAAGSMGQLGATESHLKDLQKITEQLLKKVLENPAWIMTDSRPLMPGMESSPVK